MGRWESGALLVEVLRVSGWGRNRLIFSMRKEGAAKSSVASRQGDGVPSVLSGRCVSEQGGAED